MKWLYLAVCLISAIASAWAACVVVGLGKSWTAFYVYAVISMILFILGIWVVM